MNKELINLVETILDEAGSELTRTTAVSAAVVTKARIKDFPVTFQFDKEYVQATCGNGAQAYAPIRMFNENGLDVMQDHVTDEPIDYEVRDEDMSLVEMGHYVSHLRASIPNPNEGITPASILSEAAQDTCMFVDSWHKDLEELRQELTYTQEELNGGPDFDSQKNLNKAIARLGKTSSEDREVLLEIANVVWWAHNAWVAGQIDDLEAEGYVIVAARMVEIHPIDAIDAAITNQEMLLSKGRYSRKKATRRIFRHIERAAKTREEADQASARDHIRTIMSSPEGMTRVIGMMLRGRCDDPNCENCNGNN